LPSSPVLGVRYRYSLSPSSSFRGSRRHASRRNKKTTPAPSRRKWLPISLQTDDGLFNCWAERNLKEFVFQTYPFPILLNSRSYVKILIYMPYRNMLFAVLPPLDGQDGVINVPEKDFPSRCTAITVNRAFV
jgi:hypothetical protein